MATRVMESREEEEIQHFGKSVDVVALSISRALDKGRKAMLKFDESEQLSHFMSRYNGLPSRAVSIGNELDKLGENYTHYLTGNGEYYLVYSPCDPGR